VSAEAIRTWEERKKIPFGPLAKSRAWDRLASARPTAEMISAVAQTIEALQASGTTPEGVALIVWDMIAGHVRMFAERAGVTHGKGKAR